MRIYSAVFLGAIAVTMGCSSSSTSSSSGSTSSGGTDAGESDSATTADTGGGGDSTVAATFTEVYTTVITAKCAPCHTTAAGIGVSSGMLDMTTQAVAYTNLVGTPASGSACGGKGTRVVADQPDMSIMYLKVSLDDPTPCGGKMPLGGPALSQAQADLIESWINGGAKND